MAGLGFGSAAPVTRSIGTPGDPNASIRAAAEKKLLEEQMARTKAPGGVLSGANATGGVKPAAPTVPSLAAFMGAQSGGTAYNPSTGRFDAAPSAAAPVAGAGTFASVGAPMVMPGVGVGTLTNASANNAGVDAAVGALAQRTQQLQGRETAVDPNLQTQIGRLGERLSTDTTQRAMDRAGSGARDAAAGINRTKDYELSRRGVAGGGAEGGARTMISDAATRAAAKASADIQSGELARRDALVLGGQGIMAAPGQQQLQREGNVNALTTAGVGAAAVPADLALKQQGLGIQQYTAQNAAAGSQQAQALDARQQQLREFQAMLQAAGY